MMEAQAADMLDLSKEKVNHLVYEGNLSGIYRHCLFDIVMSVLTLGIYYIVWGHFRIKRYLISQIFLDDTKIEPNYNGKELFKTALPGGILSIVLFLLVIIIFNYIINNYSFFTLTNKAPISFFVYLSSLSIKSVFTYAGNILLTPIVNIAFAAWGIMWGISPLDFLYVAWISLLSYSIILTMLLQPIQIPLWLTNYKMTHINWRGWVINHIGRNVWKYCLLSILSILSVFSLGVLSPLIDIKRDTFFWKNLFIGDRSVVVNSEIRPLMLANLKNLLWFIPTLGISRIWYWAALDRHIYNSIHIDDLKLKSAVERVDLFFLYFFHIIGTVFYAGIFIALSLAIPYEFDDFTTRILISTLLSMFITMPKIMHANMEFYTAYHFIVGDINAFDIKLRKPTEDLLMQGMNNSTVSEL